MNELMKALKGMGLKTEDPFKEVAHNVYPEDMEHYQEMVRNSLKIVFENYESKIQELVRLVNARGERINELVDINCQLEADLEKTKTKKKDGKTKRKV